jgi:hypothetical protein
MKPQGDICKCIPILTTSWYKYYMTAKQNTQREQSYVQPLFVLTQENVKVTASAESLQMNREFSHITKIHAMIMENN